MGKSYGNGYFEDHPKIIDHIQKNYINLKGIRNADAEKSKKMIN